MRNERKDERLMKMAAMLFEMFHAQCSRHYLELLVGNFVRTCLGKNVNV